MDLRTVAAPEHRTDHVERAPATRVPFDVDRVVYSLDVVAMSVADVIEHAGGWLFDLTLGGWDVTVLLAVPSDPQPLHILGAEVGSMSEVLMARRRDRVPRALALSAALCRDEPKVRESVKMALRDQQVEVRAWGDADTQPLKQLTGSASHRLSIAARAFKRAALEAAGITRPQIDSVETFRASQPVSPQFVSTSPWPMGRLALTTP